NKTRRSDAESDMCRILPVMAKRRVGIVHCRWAMHECGRPKRWFAGITEIQIRAQIVIEFLRQAQRQFVEEIVRVLSIVQRLVMPRFASLKQKRIAAALLG